tara:strand:- start:863 stop:2011 length:1149 start_codon:yes stop_codon:yes gene_type:complete
MVDLLSSRGYYVFLVCYLDPEFDYNSLDNVNYINLSLYRLKTQRFYYGLLHLIQFTLGNLSKNIQGLLQLEKYSVKLREIIDEISPDLVHGFFLTNRGFLVARSGFSPSISTAMGSDILIDSKSSPILSWIVKYSLSRSDLVTCTSNSVKRSITRMGIPSEKTVSIPYGVDLNRFPTDSSTASFDNRKMKSFEPPTLVMTRNFYPVYGVEYFLRSLPQVVKEFPKLKVFLLGDGPLRERLFRLSSELKIRDNIHFAGHVNETKLGEYLSSADIYISTSLSDGSSVSLLEAMASGLPAIVTDVDSNREWIKDGVNGYIIPKRESSILSARIIQLIEDPRLRETMGSKNKDITRQRGDMKKNLQILESYYFRLVNSSGRHKVLP